mmetsp:Transcript_3148/g.10906  ORF Transcript_3148/g.10906 Transcript_3148/m.10906 type:complete len:216 (-) Transcript_3148:316-963(-)
MHSMVALSKSSGRASLTSKRPTLASSSSSSPKSSWYSSSSLSSPSPPPPLKILFPMSPPPPASSVLGWLILTSWVRLSLDFCIVAPPEPLSWAMQVVGTVRFWSSRPPPCCVPSSSASPPDEDAEALVVTARRLLLRACLCARRARKADLIPRTCVPSRARSRTTLFWLYPTIVVLSVKDYFFLVVVVLVLWLVSARERVRVSAVRAKKKEPRGT